MMLLPPKEGTCPVCAVDHEPELAHNAQSMYYLYRFYGLHGRWPTWADAMAHCSDEMKEHWETCLRSCDEWTEPEEGEPIAEPPADAIRQAVGDVTSHTFGPDAETPINATVEKE